MTPSAASLMTQLEEHADARQAQRATRFFKTGPGEYSHGAVFIGVTMPILRVLARQNDNAALADAEQLLRSEIREARLLALLIMVNQFRMGDQAARDAVAGAYLDNIRWVNDWSLVDSSAHLILGPWLADGRRSKLDDLARSADWWERRIAIIATFHYIRQNEFADTLRIAQLLLADREDLIHKATGWMLREVGNRNRDVEEAFLAAHYRQMPRTMLRYAIEKFPEPRRQQYLRGEA